MYVSDFSPEVRPIPALRARVWIRQGRLGEALGWVREQGLSVDDDSDLPARVRAHHPRPGAPGPVHDRAREEPALADATRLLERLLRAAEEGERNGSVLEILVLQALAHQARGDTCRRAGVAATRADAGRARGLRPGLRG